MPQNRVFRNKTMLILRFFKQFWKNNEHKFVFTKTIKLLSLDFYEVEILSS